jgi:hypothetical protein
MSDVAEDSVKRGRETIGTTLLSVSGTLIDLTLYLSTLLILLYHFIMFFG